MFCAIELLLHLRYALDLYQLIFYRCFAFVNLNFNYFSLPNYSKVVQFTFGFL